MGQEAAVARWRELAGGEQVTIGNSARVEYTKAIPASFRALEQVLLRNPDWQDRLTFVQVLDRNSRAKVPGYEEEEKDIRDEAERINRRFDRRVIIISPRLDRSEMAGFYGAIDICMVASYADGQALVPKEWVIAGPPDGRLVLSRNAGSFEQLKGHVIGVDPYQTNPWHPESMARGLERALAMSQTEAMSHKAAMQTVVEATTNYHWLNSILQAIAS